VTVVCIFFDGGYEIKMYCIFYTIWFIAKCIATIENNKVVGFDNYAGNFFLLWFFPIGVWFMQPKICKIFSGDEETHQAV
jgi:hypothetical protein